MPLALFRSGRGAMARPSGVDEQNLFYISSIVFNPDADFDARIDEDLVALRSLPGVVDAIATNSVPLRGGGWSMGLAHEPGVDADDSGVAIYFTDEHGIDAFGVDLIAGRNFTADEIYRWDFDSNAWPSAGIITAAMAEELYPDSDPAAAVGKTVYISSTDPVQIVGIIDTMQAPWNGWSGVERSMLAPTIRGTASTRYVVRSEPGYRDELIPQVEELLAGLSDERIVRGMRTMEETRQRSYLEDAAMIKILVFIVSVLTAITGLGIVGLASFSVARRTKQIGTRRALGATRPAILRYFMLENFLISTIGVVSGAVIAIGLNMWLVDAFELAPIAWYLVPLAMLALWIVGQLAVLGPAKRASNVPPALATRAV